MRKSKEVCDMSSCFLCKYCIKEWLPAVESHKKNFDYKKGEVIFKEGDPVEGIYFVYKGKVKVHQKWGEDKELIIRFANSGSVFGHRGLGKYTSYPISATAIEPTTVCYISKDFFLATLKVNPNLLFETMLFYSNELQISEQKMKNLMHMSVKGRVANALLSLIDTFDLDERKFLRATLSRQDIASYAGTTYETAFRIMSEFVSDRAVIIEGKKIGIVNVDYLKEVVKQETK
ncbi:Crp/Fnr family transcriptional regulator [Solitalea canadensis]|uniref:cAMP-binding protein n=1 Tax=Solitalea canadensis (strain ATCC 29591 / DSM 3403 / JCM 21819 / LMG 8368 / NBRC 15130 / NCIMB 12057 / USAM 9D) TaxID=929556 RepID=H8KU58_SOLCM|nr:Crp/Fnr family transcriptional regulator [Solitalea canadensis]AFD07038.1 cAMP-binding protein [Solitalea canadensis DSM 3403]